MRKQRFLVVTLLVVYGVMTIACGGAGMNQGPPAPPGDMSLKEFILQKPEQPTAVQVDCRLDTYYNYSFRRCAKTHYSFRVEGGSPYASAHGYAPKTSEHGRRLYEMLKNGKGQRLTVRLQRIGPEGDALPARDDSCFALVGIVDSKN